MMFEQTSRGFLHQRAANIARQWHHPSWWNLLILLPWVLGIVFCVYQWRLDRAIAQREQITQGTVTSHEPQNHDRYGYAFMVGGKPYTGWETPKADELEIGESVTVYYDPADPSQNALTEFDERGVASLGLVPMMTMGITGLALFIFIRRRNYAGVPAHHPAR